MMQILSATEHGTAASSALNHAVPCSIAAGRLPGNGCSNKR